MKIIVCRCEDVTLADLEHAGQAGYATVEDIKRYTGLGTGPCQGKECLNHAARFASEKGMKAVPFTARSPVVPLALGVLAQADDDVE